MHAKHLKIWRSSTQTVAAVVAATVALRGQEYMRETSPKQSPRFLRFTRMLMPCRFSSTSNSPLFTTYSSLAPSPACVHDVCVFKQHASHHAFCHLCCIKKVVVDLTCKQSIVLGETEVGLCLSSQQYKQSVAG